MSDQEYTEHAAAQDDKYRLEKEMAMDTLKTHFLDARTALHNAIEEVEARYDKTDKYQCLYLYALNHIMTELQNVEGAIPQEIKA